jgi:hypothetical protein
MPIPQIQNKPYTNKERAPQQQEIEWQEDSCGQEVQACFADLGERCV